MNGNEIDMTPRKREETQYAKKYFLRITIILTYNFTKVFKNGEEFSSVKKRKNFIQIPDCFLLDVRTAMPFIVHNAYRLKRSDEKASRIF